MWFERLDKNTNITRRQGTRVVAIIQDIAKAKENGIDHAFRMTGNTKTKEITEWRPGCDKRSRGRSTTSWSHGLNLVHTLTG